MDNNQFNNNQTNQQSLTGGPVNDPKRVLPFNGDASNFRVNLPNMENAAVGEAPQMQGEEATENLKRPNMQQVPQMAQGQVLQPKKKHTGLLIAIIAFLVLAAGVVSTYFLFFTPEKRFERAMNQADSALESGNYSKAISNYEKALDIHDDDIAAMYGLLVAKQQEGADSLMNDYERLSNQLFSMDSAIIRENEQEVVLIFLMSQDVYGDDYDTTIKELEKGISLVGDNALLWEAWCDVKLNEADLIEADDKNKALEIYSEVLDKQPERENAISGFTRCWESLVKGYVDAYAYEPAQALLDKYNGKVSTINFADYQSKITYAKAIAEQGFPLMEKTYNAMAAGDYKTMCEIDLGDELSNFMAYVNGNFMWAPDGFTDDYTGVALGLYKRTIAGEILSSYFYYGDYVDGKRCGQGVCFFAMDLDIYQYQLFSGEWDNDKPNGFGVYGDYHGVLDDESDDEAESETEYYDFEESGNYVNGYANGEINASLTSSAGYTVSGTFRASMGDAPDVRDQYPDEEFAGSEGSKVYLVMTNGERTWWLSARESFKVRAAAWIEE